MSARSSPARRILFVGDDWIGSNARSLRDAYVQLGHRVYTIDTSRWSRPPRASYEYVASKVSRSSPVSNRLNELVVSVAATLQPDLSLVFRGLWLRAEAVERLRRESRALVHYHPDDIGNSANVSYEFLSSIEMYDLHVTTKSYNVQEYQDRGAGSVLYVPCAYDPSIHCPVESPTVQYDACFVGAPRPERIEMLRRLSSGRAVRLRVAGRGWWRYLRPSGQLEVSGPVEGLEMAELVGKSKVALGFLNRQNRDLHTTRTFELPGCGACVLAERGREQEAFFRENEEALYFSGYEELEWGLSELLRDEGRRRSMKRNAQRRLIELKATYVDRASTIMERLG